MKNDDLTARQLLRVIEIQIFRSDFETAAQLSIECCFFHFESGGGGGGVGGGGANLRKISDFLNSDTHPNIWKFLEFLKGEQSNTELRK